MDEALKFFKLIQLTRSQPQYGYVLAGIKKADLSDLAQHHYLVTLTAWYIAHQIIKIGGKINIGRVLEIALIHDLGELFGGDISMPYAVSNPAAQKLAKQFEAENQRFVAELIPSIGGITQLFREASVPESAEAVVAKIADYIEVTHYKHYHQRMTPGDVSLANQKLQKFVAQLSDSKTKTFLTKFINNWSEVLSQDDGSELLESAKTV